MASCQARYAPKYRRSAEKESEQQLPLGAEVLVERSDRNLRAPGKFLNRGAFVAFFAK